MNLISLHFDIHCLLRKERKEKTPQCWCVGCLWGTREQVSRSPLRSQIRTEQCSTATLIFEEHSIVFSWKRLHNYLSLQLPTTPRVWKKTIKKHTHILCAFSPFPTNIILPTCQPTLQATKKNCRVCIACFPQFPTTTTTANCHVLCLWWVEC
jgi:hypothetical protein